MPAFICCFGYETPRQARNNLRWDWEDENSYGLTIEADNEEAALLWGQAVAERFIKLLYRDKAISWMRIGFSDWIEKAPEEPWEMPTVSTRISSLGSANKQAMLNSVGCADLELGMLHRNRPCDSFRKSGKVFRISKLSTGIQCTRVDDDMAHKKGQGSSRNGRDSNPQMLGIKLYGGQAAKAGSIDCRQKGTRWRPGKNIGVGRDWTLFSLIEGTVKFDQGGRRINIVPRAVASADNN
jgi:large subunit ribosomal protein L27